MKPIRVINPDTDWCRHDCKRIVEAMARFGYECGMNTAKILWDKYSDSMSAAWMGLPEEDCDIVSRIRPYFEEDDGDE